MALEGKGKNRMMGIRLTALAVLAALMSVGSPTLAQERLYPPYPDVWGRELPRGGIHKTDTGADLYPRSDGDMLIYKVFMSGHADTEEWSARRISFFSGEDVLTSFEERNKLEDKWQTPGLWRWETSRFPNGSWLVNVVPYYPFHWSKCMSLPIYAWGQDGAGHGYPERIFVRLLPPERLHKASCPDGQRPPMYRTRIRFSSISYSPNHVLMDGTFLVVMDRDLVIRLDETLNSPFIDNRPDLFALDFDQIEPILDEASRREKEPGFNDVQFIYDRVTDLVLSLPKPTPH